MGSGTLQELMVTALVNAPPSATPLDAVAAALDAAGAVLQDRFELIKLASLAAALGDGLRRRGTSGPTATLTAEAGIAVFRVAFERWVTETAPQDLPQLIRESLEELRGVAVR